MLIVAACGSYGEAPAGDPPPTQQPPAIAGTPEAGELTEQVGVFVTPAGRSGAAGTRLDPLGSIAEAIDVARARALRVYVCAGTYHESIVLADGVSLLGGLDCSSLKWQVDGNRSKLRAPTSPAIRARELRHAVRVEGFDVTAPDGVQPSESSFGLIAESSALTIANSRIAAGDAQRGADGKPGLQLTLRVTRAAQSGPWKRLECRVDGLSPDCSTYWGPAGPRGHSGGVGAVAVCDGEPGHDPEGGGTGGTSGVFWCQPQPNGVFWESYRGVAAQAGEMRTGAAGEPGADGASAAGLGSFSPEGYSPADGTPGQSGAPGKGGAGQWAQTLAGSCPDSQGIYSGPAGAGGGAGGCPGLAGTPGTGGGASVAALVLESPNVTFEGVELVAGKGGDGGKGAFGSNPLAGTAGAAAPVGGGGRGGRAGVSGSGGGGPSIAIVHKGPAPKLVAGSVMKHSVGGAGVAEQKSADGTLSIPSSASGTSEAVHAL